MFTSTRPFSFRHETLSAFHRLYTYLYFTLASCAMVATPVPGVLFGLASHGLTGFRKASRVLRNTRSIFLQASSALLLILCPLILLFTRPHMELLACVSLFFLLPAGLSMLYATIPPAVRRMLFTILLALGALLLWPLSLGRFTLPLMLGFVPFFTLTWLIEFRSAPSLDAAQEADKTLQPVHAARTGVSLLLSLMLAMVMTVCLLLRLFPLPASWAIGGIGCFFGGLVVSLLSVLLRKKIQPKTDPANAVLLGTLLWFPGLICLQYNTLSPFLSGFALTGLGLGLCLLGSFRLLNGLRLALPLLISHAEEATAPLLQAWEGFAQGLAFAIACLGLLLQMTGFDLPLLFLGTLVLIFLGWTTSAFPLHRKYLDKLSTLHQADASGENNPALQKQLVAKLTDKTPHSLLLMLIIDLFRRFFPIQVIGADKVRMDPDNPPIFLCNHGDLYGPIAAFLSTPQGTRPWSISTIVVDHPTAFAYLYKYDWEPKTFLPVWVRKCCAHVIASVAIWGTGLLECIPVFRDHPVELRKTFRHSIDALVSGDPLLIFPENPNALGQDHGYETDKIGELFSGFAMIAPGYYNRTGKCCRFIPMCAHQASKTLMFGDEIIFDPNNDPADERQRIADETAIQLHAMFDRKPSAAMDS